MIKSNHQQAYVILQDELAKSTVLGQPIEQSMPGSRKNSQIYYSQAWLSGDENQAVGRLLRWMYLIWYDLLAAYHQIVATASALVQRLVATNQGDIDKLKVERVSAHKMG